MLEICVEDQAGLQAAIAGGADRIELCAALSVGGLTPPASLVAIARAAPIPVHLLARPREGDFVYRAAEAAQVADDITLAVQAGLAGVVIGASDTDRRLDTALLAEWVAHARRAGAARGRPLSLTLHRAFDLCPDLAAALEQAVALGFDRILTSGGAPRAVDAVARLAALHVQADGRIAILAGSGVDETTLPAILATGVGEVHASARTPRPFRPDRPEARFGFVSAAPKATDPAVVARLKAMLTAHQQVA